MQIDLMDYYNRFSAEKNWKRVLTISGRGIQAPEFNEAQDMIALELRRLGDAIFADGNIISGCECNVDPDTGIVSLGSGRIYAKGMVWPVESAEMHAPEEGTLEIGIRIREQIVTELEDGTLRDPSVGCPNYMQPGAARLTARAEWSTEGGISSSEIFCPIYTITNRILIVNNKKSKDSNLMDEFIEALARYDRDSHGHYVVRGMLTSVVSVSEGTQRFNVSEGLAHVRGYEVKLPYSVPLVVEEVPKFGETTDEPHSFQPDGDGNMRVDLRHGPVEAIREISVRKAKTVSIVHGSYTGCADPLPDTSVVSIVAITQDATTYVQGTDFQLTADRADWSLPGNEPAPGSTYQITYQYRTAVAPISPDSYGFNVSGLVPDSEIFVDYQYRLLRKDLIVIDKEGQVRHVPGVSHRYAPAYPAEPAGTLTLALVDQDWEGSPKITPCAVRAVPMSELESMQAEISRLFDLVAIERLRTDAIIAEPTATRGVFVDPFLDDDMRDAGMEQTAAVVDGELMLPIAAETDQFGEESYVLPYDYEPLVEQLYKTGKMPVNPYQAFDPLPASISVDPAIDRWNITNTQWASPITKTFKRGRVSSRTSKTQTLESREVTATIMRQRSVALEGKGFGPSEEFTAFFGGYQVASGNANETGEIFATFEIPPGIPVGTALVEVTGAGGTRGATTYVGTGTVTTQTLRKVTTVIKRIPYDPLAQTFLLPQSRSVAGVELWFETAGASPVRVQIRTVENGIPTGSILAEGEILPEEIRVGAPTRVELPPVYLDAGVSYAFVVLTDTPDHEVALAELGGWDNKKGRVRAQPYGGVLLSSANAETWTAHQTMDLWFRILGARFEPTTRRIHLGDVTFTSVTDILSLVEVEYPAVGTEATFLFTHKTDTDKFVSVQSGQSVALQEAISGEYAAEIELVGTEHASPRLYGGSQILKGTLGNTGDYISRAFLCGANKNVRICIEGYLPGSSTMRIYVQTGVDTWEEAPLENYEEVGDQWRRYNYSQVCSFPESRVKIALQGSPAERPLARLLRAVVVDA